jgi:hypothetical protein
MRNVDEFSNTRYERPTLTAGTVPIRVLPSAPVTFLKLLMVRHFYCHSTYRPVFSSSQNEYVVCTARGTQHCVPFRDCQHHVVSSLIISGSHAYRYCKGTYVLVKITAVVTRNAPHALKQTLGLQTFVKPRTVSVPYVLLIINMRYNTSISYLCAIGSKIAHPIRTI